MNIGKSKEEKEEENIDEVVKRIQKKKFKSQINNSLSMKFCSVSA